MTADFKSAFAHVLARIEASEDLLGRLDSASGDGDHGRTLVRGLKAAVAAVPPDGTLGECLVTTGSAFAAGSGGTSGALFGALVMSTGRALKKGSSVDQALQVGIDRVKRLGGAEVGDKTMVDALEPFCLTLAKRLTLGEPLAEAWHHAVDAAREAAEATAGLVARKGRSAALGERSVGQPDPGAVSTSIILGAIGECLAPSSSLQSESL